MITASEVKDNPGYMSPEALGKLPEQSLMRQLSQLPLGRYMCVSVAHGIGKKTMNQIIGGPLPKVPTLRSGKDTVYIFGWQPGYLAPGEERELGPGVKAFAIGIGEML